MELPDWWYDDARQVGLDFADAAQVATYDARQGRRSEQDLALLRQLGLTADMAMADIGCGTGLLVCEAGRICRSALGIDVSPAMLTAARARAAGLEAVSFQQAGFLSFEVEDGSLDLITTKNALHHLPDFWKALALHRMFLALKPGGTLYIRDVMFNEPPGRLAAAAEAWVSWLPANSGYSREEVAAHVREEHSTFAWVIDRMLGDCGFRVTSHTQDGVYGTIVAERPG